jgi:uncharacterized protein YegP (UPF0339 family)
MLDPRFEIVDDKNGGFHARYISGNQIIWWTENYRAKADAKHAVYSISENARPAPLYDRSFSGRLAG